jgi:NDP-sugar pyrophosphorylase family protein
LLTDGRRLVEIDEKPGRTDLVNAGMYVVSPEILAELTAEGPLGMPDVIDVALAYPNGVNVYRFDGVWNDVGSHDELERVRLMYAEYGDLYAEQPTRNETEHVL